MRAKPSSSCTYFTHFNSINQKTAAPEVPEARACHADNMYMCHTPSPPCYSQGVRTSHICMYIQHSPPGPLPQRPWTVACLIVRQVRKTFCLPCGCHDSCRQTEAQDNGTTPKASMFMGTLGSCGSNENSRAN